MASTGQTNHLLQDIMLTPEQQSALLQAFNKQKQHNLASITPPTSNPLSLSPSSFNGSPQQGAGYNSFQESPYMDNYDYSFGDSSFDFDPSNDTTATMIGDLPGVAKSESTENEGTEKRAHPDDDEDDEAMGKGGAKRRESGEKVPKKPGRKPLTSEPTSKRKAQNRAAQRAFRERKEKHLKDLEDKVVELEKKTEVTTSENTALRAQLELVTAELNEYKRKMQTVGPARSFSGSRVNNGFGHAAVNNLSDVNFQFEFPKFGALPGPPQANNANSKSAQQSSTASTPRSGNNASASQQMKNESRQSSGASPGSSASLSKSELASFSAVFASPHSNQAPTNGSRPSMDSGHYSIGAGTTSSPSASSTSNMGPSSSCGTSPEPFTQSPMGFKPLDTMTTIGEEQSSLTSNNSQTFNNFEAFDVNGGGFDWLAQQNGGQFDPQLFGDYREPIANANFDDMLNDLDPDFFTPYNMPSQQQPQQNQQRKKSLISEIDAKQNADDESPEAIKKEKYNCSEVWQQLQNCPKVQSGDVDLDSLCSELQKKAKCSGTGPVVKDHDFKDILKKYLGNDLAKSCNDSPKQTVYP